VTFLPSIKRLLLLGIAVQLFAACEKKPDFLKTESEKAAEKATPPPTPTPAPKGNWMWNGKRTMLDQKKK
jgi:hypothetical protein